MLHRVQTTVFADYFQFYLWDVRADPRAPEEWNDQDVSNRLKTALNVVVVCPVRNMVVPVTLELHEETRVTSPTSGTTSPSAPWTSRQAPSRLKRVRGKPKPHWR